jgi:hypothetical protein
MTGAGPELIWFVLAALAFGLSAWPLLAWRASAAGRREPALIAVLLALSAPVALVGATLPGAAACELLGATILFAALARERCSATARATAWLCACALHTLLVWTWPALLAAELTSAAPATAAALPAGLAAPFAFAALFLGAHALSGDLHGGLHRAERDLLAGGSGGPGPWLAWWTLWLPALGASGLGLVAFGVQLVRARAWRRELALVLFALVPLAAVSLGGSLDWEIPWLWLVPPGALGLLELLQRAEERGRGAWARLAVLPLLAWGLLGAGWLRGLDANARWSAQASALLNPGDVVLSASLEHRHLLERRFHLETVDLLPIAGQGRAERQRFWAEERTRAAQLAAAGRRLVLDEDSLVTLGTLSWPDAAEIDAFAHDAPALRLPALRAGADGAP